MPKGKKRNKKKHIRRAAVNEKYLFKCIEILMKHNGIQSIKVQELAAATGYDFTFEPDKDYNDNQDVKMICTCLGAYMDINRLEHIELVRAK